MVPFHALRMATTYARGCRRLPRDVFVRVARREYHHHIDALMIAAVVIAIAFAPRRGKTSARPPLE